MCFKAPPSGSKTAEPRGTLSFEEKGPKTAPLGHLDFYGYDGVGRGLFAVQNLEHEKV